MIDLLLVFSAQIADDQFHTVNLHGSRAPQPSRLKRFVGIRADLISAPGSTEQLFQNVFGEAEMNIFIRKLALYCLVVCMPTIALAAPQDWTVQNVVFADGGTASGSFTYDSNTNQFSNINIVTTAGTTVTQGATYVIRHPLYNISPAFPLTTLPFIANTNGDPLNHTNEPFFQLTLYAQMNNNPGTLTVRSGIYGTATAEGKCLDAACNSLGPTNPTRQVADFGIVTTNPIPTVAIDVLPGDAANKVYPNKAGQLPVAVLSSGEFDASQVDPATLAFGPAEATVAGAVTIADVDGQFGPDTTAKFRVEESGIFCNDNEVFLTGQTYAGVPFAGRDTIDATECQTGGCHPY